MPPTRSNLSKRAREPTSPKAPTSPKQKKGRGRPRSVVQCATTRPTKTKTRSSRLVERREDRSGSTDTAARASPRLDVTDNQASIAATLAGIQKQITLLSEDFGERISSIQKSRERSRSSTPRSRRHEATPPATTPSDATPDGKGRRRSRALTRTCSPSPRQPAKYFDGRRADGQRRRSAGEATHRRDRHYSRESNDRRYIPSYAPSPFSDDSDDARNDVVNELLVAAGSALGKRRGKNILAPHKYVIRGSRNEKIGLEEAAWHEYFAAMSRMCWDKKLPAGWPEHIREHMYQLALMAANWDWHTCRQWSETVFTMIADGRLRHGWKDRYAIKDVQRDVCAIGTRAERPKQAVRAPRRYDAPASTTTYAATEARPATDHTRPSYDKDLDGKPCQQWNWGEECGFTTSHGIRPDRKCHLCAWCANKYKRANAHQEKVCFNKKRYFDKLNGPSKEGAKKDF